MIKPQYAECSKKKGGEKCRESAGQLEDENEAIIARNNSTNIDR